MAVSNVRVEFLLKLPGFSATEILSDSPPVRIESLPGSSPRPGLVTLWVENCLHSVHKLRQTFWPLDEKERRPCMLAGVLLLSNVTD